MLQVQNYGHILERQQRDIPGVHIAGGAVRDTILGRSIRDVDVFLADADAAATLLRSEFGYVKVGQWVAYEGFPDPMVARVAKFERADATIPICFDRPVTRARPEAEHRAFRPRHLHGSLDRRHAQMITTDYFRQDAEMQTFTLLRADKDAQFACSMVRFRKLTADRYKEWTLSVPKEFEELAREHGFRKLRYKTAPTSECKNTKACFDRKNAEPAC